MADATNELVRVYRDAAMKWLILLEFAQKDSATADVANRVSREHKERFGHEEEPQKTTGN